MIRLKKGDPRSPDYERARARLKEAAREYARGKSDAKKRMYRDHIVKEALFCETRNKCAYCESDVRHIAFGDVEHILPKSRDPRRVLDYDNLTIACPICNNNKSDYEGSSPATRLLDPYIDDPAKHLLFAGPVLFPYNDSTRGELTIETMDLNRTWLLEKRKTELCDFYRLIQRYQKARRPEVLQMCLRAVRKAMDQNVAYSSMKRTLCKQFAPAVVSEPVRGRQKRVG